MILFWKCTFQNNKSCDIFSQLSEEVELMKKDNRRLQAEMDERKLDMDKFKALQSHASHQQMLLHQLRNRLEQHEWVAAG